MTTVTSFRLYCQDCSNEEVFREPDIADSPWKILNKHYHEGICPRCNDAVSLSEVENPDRYRSDIQLKGLDHIGEKAAQNLRQAGYDSFESIKNASDEELLSISWVGEKGLFSLKEAVREHDPQKRWEND